jgi:hypothetical protein
MDKAPLFDKPNSRQVDCVAAWQKQEGRPVAPQKQAQERLVEMLLRTTQKPNMLSQAVSSLLTTRSGRVFMGLG